MQFVWDEQYSVHVHVIDEQHKHYFEIANRIFAKLDTGQVDKTELALMVKELVDYAFYHFQVEEKFFKDFNYPEAAAHLELHDSYRKTMKVFMAKMEDPNVEVGQVFQELAEFATDWFANHILVEDKKYTQCFTEHGLV